MSKEGAAHEQMNWWWLAQCHKFTVVAVGSFGLLIGIEVGGRAQQEPGSQGREEGPSQSITCPSWSTARVLELSLQEDVWKILQEECVHVYMDCSQKCLPGSFLAWEGHMGETVWASKLQTFLGRARCAWLPRSTCVREGPCNGKLWWWRETGELDTWKGR